MASAALPGPDQPSSPITSAPRLTLWIGRFFLLLWAAFWLWFNIASAISEDEGRRSHVIFACIAAALTLTAWFLPRIGGVLMILAGAAAMWDFHSSAAVMLLAAPGAIIGIILLFSER